MSRAETGVENRDLALSVAGGSTAYAEGRRTLGSIGNRLSTDRHRNAPLRLCSKPIASDLMTGSSRSFWSFARYGCRVVPRPASSEVLPRGYSPLCSTVAIRSMVVAPGGYSPATSAHASRRSLVSAMGW